MREKDIMAIVANNIVLFVFIINTSFLYRVNLREIAYKKQQAPRFLPWSEFLKTSIESGLFPIVIL